MRWRAGCCPSWWIGFAVAGCTLVPIRAAAQSPESTSLTLNDAVQLARKNYPAIQESRARAQAASEGIGVARTAYLPRLDIIWQENRATNNARAAAAAVGGVHVGARAWHPLAG